MIEAQAFWVAEPGRGEIRRQAVAEPGRGEVLVEARTSGISRGTETLVFRGGVPSSQAAAMRCPFQEGDFPAPVKYGYASVGVVTGGASPLRGRRVFCLYPHQDRYVVGAAAAIPIPDAVPDARAVLAANMETAVNALWDAAPLIGDRIAVIGAGVVGCLLASLLRRIPGIRVELVDVDPARAAAAAALGCAFRAPEAATTEADLVFHCSGRAEGLATALRLAAFEARIVELSWYGDRAVAAPLGEAFHARRLVLMSSQVGSVAPARRARRSHRDRLILALQLLADPVYDALIDGVVPFASLPQTMAALAAGENALCRVVRY